MSPSNPATLREAIERVELMADDDSNWDLSPNDRAALQTLLTALAASGTEAAPVTCESCKSTNTQRYENAGGLKMYSCTDCGWHHEVPAQAAASPEGEGRETPEEYKFNCKWKLVPSNRPVNGVDPDDVTKEFVYELPGETRVNGNVGAWYQSAVYWKHRALRQSAAPSGGLTYDLAIRQGRLEEVKYIAGADWDCLVVKVDIEIVRTFLAERISELLAQQSKTGAVTETK